MLIRKIASVFRGKATPRQVLLATTLGGLLGFVPGFFLPGDLGGGFLQAPGLILALLCLVLVLNANLGVFGIVTLVAKLLSLVVLPVSYAVGTFLIDTMPGLFGWLVNSKVTAWFGLDRYATAGGLLLGLVFGVLSGVLLNRTIKTIRVRMADAEQNSERYQKFAKKGWVKVATWILLGKGKGKLSWQELATSQKRGLPIRIFGVLVAGVLVASLWVFQQWFSTPILTQNLRAGLAAMNGATVDVEAATLDLGSGMLRIKNLAIADSKELDKDLFAATELTATLDMGELLRARFVIDEVRSTSARTGSARSVRGALIPKAKEPEPPPPPAGTKTIEDYLKDYEIWKQRFDQAREWFEVVAGKGEPAPPAVTPPEVVKEQRKAQANDPNVGLAKVVALHLREPGPAVLVRRIDIEGIGYSIDGAQDKLDLRARNVSTAPSLVADTPSLAVQTQSDKLLVELTGRSKDSPALGFQFALRHVPVDSVFGKLKISGAAPVRGGTMDIDTKGTFTKVAGQAMTIDLPLRVAMQGATFALPGAKETLVENLLLPIGVRGSVTRPAVSLDDKALQDALLAAGKQELAKYVQGQAGKLLGGLPPNLQGIVDPSKSPEQIVDDVKAKADAEAARLQEEAKQKAEAEKKRLEAEAKKKLEDELKKKLQGILPGGRGGGV